jgi:hypothetical protein
MCERVLVTILTQAAPPSPSSKPTTSIGDKCQLRTPFIRNPPVRSRAISPKIERPVSAAPDWLADGRLPAHSCRSTRSRERPLTRRREDRLNDRSGRRAALKVSSRLFHSPPAADGRSCAPRVGFSPSARRKPGRARRKALPALRATFPRFADPWSASPKLTGIDAIQGKQNLVMPADARMRASRLGQHAVYGLVWIPASAGMTMLNAFKLADISKHCARGVVGAQPGACLSRAPCQARAR